MATRPVTLFVFNTLTGPVNEPVSVLDTNLANLQNAVDDPLISSNVALDVGSVNAYAATITPGPAALNSTQIGLLVALKVGTSNTGASTFNLNGLGALTIVGGTGTGIASGQMISGQVSLLAYTGSFWQLLNPVVSVTAPNSTGLSQASLNLFYW